MPLTDRLIGKLVVLLAVWPTLAPQALVAADAAHKAEKLLTLQRPLVIGHRGFAAAAPENTLPSFKLALAAAADLVELDYYHTRDGVPVVIHDADLDRTTDSVKRWGSRKTRVESKTAAELRSLDAGSWKDSQFAGAQLPLLTEALDLIQSNGVTLIERKAGDPATCVKLLTDRNLMNEVIVQAFDWEFLRGVHALEPAQILGALGPPATQAGRKLSEGEKKLNAEWIEKVRDSGARLVVWNKMLDRAAVETAHRRGLKVWVYTINDAETANHLLDLGVDGIISDNPVLIWRTLALRASAAR